MVPGYDDFFKNHFYRFIVSAYRHLFIKFIFKPMQRSIKKELIHGEGNA